MGRPSKLTARQWEDIGKRLLSGEKARALGREFGVSESTIRERFSDVNGKIKDVANQMLATETALKALPISAQIAAHDLVAQLRSISGHLAGAANYGAATAHRLAGIAHSQVEQVDDAEPEKSEHALRRIAALTNLANNASTIGLNLLSANREMVKQGMQDAPPQPVKIVVQVEDASRPES